MIHYSGYFTAGTTLKLQALVSVAANANAATSYFTVERRSPSQVVAAQLPFRTLVYTSLTPGVNANSWYEVYSDGWVKQANYGTYGSATTVTFAIPFTDANYSFIDGYISNSSSAASNQGVAGGYANKLAASIQVFATKSFIVEGWGASASVAALGARPNY